MDDILLTWSCISEINKFKKVLENAYNMNDLGNMVYFLGMEILYSKKGIFMRQLKYELELLKRFELMNCKSTIKPIETKHKLESDYDGKNIYATTLKHLVGCLRYMCNTRHGICYIVGIVSRFMSNSK